MSKIVGFNGTPNCPCGIVTPIILDSDGFYKLMGTRDEPPINKVTFDAYVKEERITKLLETKGKNNDAILYVKKELFEKFIPQGEGHAWNILCTWVENEDFGFIVDKKGKLVKQMDELAKVLHNHFDSYYHESKRDNNYLLDIAELSVSCAYNPGLRFKGYKRLALVYKILERPDRIETLYNTFIMSEFGWTKEEINRFFCHVIFLENILSKV